MAALMVRFTIILEYRKMLSSLLSFSNTWDSDIDKQLMMVFAFFPPQGHMLYHVDLAHRAAAGQGGRRVSCLAHGLIQLCRTNSFSLGCPCLSGWEEDQNEMIIVRWLILEKRHCNMNSDSVSMMVLVTGDGLFYLSSSYVSNKAFKSEKNGKSLLVMTEVQAETLSSF
ncbi:Solute Carrier Family 22 Member 13 [Manis pentadactyla]|nr:Solute Carrier Family 22 Member 13 [Manis pentadactyla]